MYIKNSVFPVNVTETSLTLWWAECLWWYRIKRGTKDTALQLSFLFSVFLLLGRIGAVFFHTSAYYSTEIPRETAQSLVWRTAVARLLWKVNLFDHFCCLYFGGEQGELYWVILGMHIKMFWAHHFSVKLECSCLTPSLPSNSCSVTFKNLIWSSQLLSLWQRLTSRI